MSPGRVGWDAWPRYYIQPDARGEHGKPHLHPTATLCPPWPMSTTPCSSPTPALTGGAEGLTSAAGWQWERCGATFQGRGVEPHAHPTATTVSTMANINNPDFTMATIPAPARPQL